MDRYHMPTLDTPDEIIEPVFAQLTLARKARRLTQQQLATTLGISRATVSRIENGNRDLLVSLLITWCGTLGVTLTLADAHLTATAPPPPAPAETDEFEEPVGPAAPPSILLQEGPALLYVTSGHATEVHGIDSGNWDPARMTDRERSMCLALLDYAATRINRYVADRDAGVTTMPGASRD